METIIVWFRNDLRLHDHEALHKASLRAQQLVPVYCLDPQWLQPNQLGLPKMGAFRTQFLLQALANLRAQLRQLGSDLLLRVGSPAQVLAEVQAQTKATAIYTSQEVCSEELHDEQAVEMALAKQGCRLVTYWQSTLFHLDDLPFPIKFLPDVFTEFRKQAEKTVRVRKLFPRPAKLAPLPPGLAPGELPTLASLGLEETQPDTRGVLPFAGGETEGLARLQHYFWQTDSIKVYKETRNGLLGANYSSKFSAWLALGCLSPRYVWNEVARYEAQRIKNDSTYWLIFELIWRDYFRFVAKKYGNTLFLSGGIKNEQDLGLSHNEKLFWKWADGQTGVPFIDANMRELKLTGFMSNRGRQNVASFLVKDLRIDWRWGAAYFESLLVDYDVCSNWGNWNYVAGVGNDPRENRYFNILRQARQYDPKGEYVKHWLPELAKVPAAHVHHLGELNRSGLQQYGVHLGGNYPQAMVNVQKWLTSK